MKLIFNNIVKQNISRRFVNDLNETKKITGTYYFCSKNWHYLSEFASLCYLSRPQCKLPQPILALSDFGFFCFSLVWFTSEKENKLTEILKKTRQKLYHYACFFKKYMYDTLVYVCTVFLFSFIYIYIFG